MSGSFLFFLDFVNLLQYIVKKIFPSQKLEWYNTVFYSTILVRV